LIVIVNSNLALFHYVFIYLGHPPRSQQNEI
jgi:hypothetical protein